MLKGMIPQHLKYQSMFCSYNANLKLTAIKHAEGTSNCDGHGSSTQQENFYDMNDTILEFVLRQMK
jgi:hypothetical protein